MYSNFDNYSEQSEQNDQEQGGYCQLSNPLDYLADEEIDMQLMMPRKPRSSIESSDRRLEIPACQPAYISRHLRDSSKRMIYDPVDSFSPQPVNRKPLF